jgi:hypothetical protein
MPLRVNMCLRGLTLEQVDPLSNLAAAGTYEGLALEQARVDPSNLCGTRLEQMVARRKELHLAMVANLREELSLEADAMLREVRGHRERVSGAFHPCEPPPC